MDRQIEICFRLSAAESILQVILDQLESCSDQNDRQLICNLRQVVKCLVQTRARINTRFLHIKSSRPPPHFTAHFESRIQLRGLLPDAPDKADLLHDQFDISDSLEEVSEEETAKDQTVSLVELRAYQDAEAASKEEPADTKDEVVVAYQPPPRDKKAAGAGDCQEKVVKQEETVPEIKVEYKVEYGEEIEDAEVLEYADLFFGGQGEEEDEELEDVWLPHHQGYKDEPGGYDQNSAVVPVDGRRECELCGKMVTTKSYTQHINLHEEKKRSGTDHPCEVCGKCFTMRIELLRHLRVHRNTGSEPSSINEDQSGQGTVVKRECEICGKMVNHGGPYYSHIRLHLEKQKEGKDHPCTFCKKSFTMGVELKRHMSVHMEENPELFANKPDQEPGNGDLDDVVKSGKKRRKRVHTGEKPFACSECGKSFSKKLNLKLHKRIHGPRERILCQTCGKSFLSPNSLKAHLQKGGCENTDQTGTELSCKICGKVVKNESYLRFHMKVHSDEKPYSCEVCGETFRRPYEINKHKIHKHEQPRCDMCAKSFKSTSALFKHQRVVHSDERPFSCDMCGKAYKDKFVLEKHKRIHNKEEHVKCDVCAKYCLSIADLNKHYQKAHIQKNENHMKDFHARGGT